MRSSTALDKLAQSSVMITTSFLDVLLATLLIFGGWSPTTVLIVHARFYAIMHKSVCARVAYYPTVATAKIDILCLHIAVRQHRGVVTELATKLGELLWL